MLGLRLKSIRLYVTLCFVLVILCAAGGKEGDPKDVPKDDVKDTDPKDAAKEGATDEKSKIILKSGATDEKSKIIVKQGATDEKSKIIVKEGATDEKSKIIVKQGATDEKSKIIVKQGATDEKSKIIVKQDPSNKDQVTLLLESLSPEDIAKLENMTEEEMEKKTVFLSPEESCDFLGTGPLFDDPDYHKSLLHDYVTMERFGYWEIRCEEFAYKNPEDPKDKDTAAQKPLYCT